MSRFAVATLGLLLLASAPSDAQPLPRPWAEWRTISTAHFDVHHSAELAAWSEEVAGRLEAVHEAVNALVGYAPAERVTVVVHDPLGASNGFAYPGAVLVLWPAPPDPGSMLATSRGWSELLAVHEYAHVAHLARPSRNPRERWLERLLPVAPGPIALRAPRWATEGYATLVEGRVTGDGRPYGAWRAAVLREWALAGRLPSYGALDREGSYLEGAVPYLAGSAFLEWLEADAGGESLPHLWRRLTARSPRDFDEAFTGVFGGPPAELWGRFTVAVTGRALAVEEALKGAGIEEGSPWQRLDGWTEDLTVSPDGRHLAAVRQPDPDLSRDIVVWTTAEDTLTDADRAARARDRERDPEDVPDVEWRPRSKTPVARLAATAGRGARAPRWLPDGEGILVVRPEALGDGRVRSDLFVWRWRDGSLRRVTRGAGIRDADPEPAGTSAVGTRCLDGACDLVRIDLTTGGVARLADGVPGERSWHRPRVSPDGARIVAAVQEAGRWRLALLSPDGRDLGTAGPDDGATRFDTEWLPGGAALVTVSDRSGIHDLERIDPAAATARPLTRVRSAALSPAPAPDGGIYFAHLTTHGLDVRRADAGAELTAAPALESGWAPAVPPASVPVPALATGPVGPVRPYGAGPREITLWPMAYGGAEGWALGAFAHGVDPVGRLGWTVRGLAGGESAWRGAGAAVEWRGWRPALRAEAFHARHRPSAQDLDGPSPTGDGPLDLEMAGGSVSLEYEHRGLGSGRALRAGGSAARLSDGPLDGADRAVAWAEADAWWLQTRGALRLVEALRLHGAKGETDGEGWTRGVVRLALAATVRGTGLRADGLWGRTDPGPAGFESFAFGGTAPPLFGGSVLSQRLPDPALPVGYAGGAEAASVRLAWVSPGGAETYYRWMSAGGSLDDWVRVYGSEVALDAPPLPFLGLPPLRFVFGLARTLDPPLEDETRLYGGFTVGP